MFAYQQHGISTSHHLSFDGKPLSEYQRHTSNVYTTAIVTTKTYTYDHADRLQKVTHQLNNGEVVTLSDNVYNELGQLLNKKLQQSASYTAATQNDYLQKLDYSYNIRGWLNGINKPYANSAGYEESDLFNFELHYNTSNLNGGVAQYNGNIAEQVWKGGYDEYLRGYKYGYDKANNGDGDGCFIDAPFHANDVLRAGCWYPGAGQALHTNNGAGTVLNFAALMMEDHGGANEKVKKLAAERNVTLPATPGDDEQKKATELSKKTGKDFDKAYVDAMVKGHSETVDMFKKASGKVGDADVKAFIDNTIPVIEHHL